MLSWLVALLLVAVMFGAGLVVVAGLLESLSGGRHEWRDED